MQAAGWTLAHAANKKEVRKFHDLLDSISLDDGAIQKYGGLKKYKESVKSLFDSKDPYVRGFGAIYLGVIGDRNDVPAVAKLLQYHESQAGKKKRKGNDEDQEGFDCSRAAIALGLLGAKEHTDDLVHLLGSPSFQERGGAALGLGYLQAVDQAGEVARLLLDTNDQVQTDAIVSLAAMNATQFAPDIARLLERNRGSDVLKVAGYALARLGAKEHANAIARLLEAEFSRGNAAKALALMGAAEYAGAIAKLLEDESPLVRQDAAIALGILKADKYANEVHKLLGDKEGFVRVSAAAVLILMESSDHAKDAFALLEENGAGRIVLNDFHPIVAEDARRLNNRFQAARDRLSK